MMAPTKDGQWWWGSRKRADGTILNKTVWHINELSIGGLMAQTAGDYRSYPIDQIQWHRQVVLVDEPAPAKIAIFPAINLGCKYGVAIGGRWNGWLFYQHADGHWVSLQKLDSVGLWSG